MSGSPDVPALRSDHSASRDYHFAFRQVTNIPHLARFAMLLHPFPRRIPGRAWLAAFGTKSRNFPHFEALFRPSPFDSRSTSGLVSPACRAYPSQSGRGSLRRGMLPNGRCVRRLTVPGNRKGIARAGLRIRPCFASRLRSMGSASPRQRAQSGGLMTGWSLPYGR